MSAAGGRGRRPILLIGAGGQIGWELHRLLQPLAPVVAPARAALDLGDADGIRRAVREARPGLVINAAAYTNVDAAEENETEAMAINAVAPGVLAEECKRAGAGLIHYSTDYVFDGLDPKDANAPATRPYVETDPTRPLNVYGRSKLAGEKAVQAAGGPHLILRTSWIYSRRGRNFLLTIQRLARERDELRIVDDQRGSPTWARMVAAATAAIIARGLAAGGGVEAALGGTGRLYHLSASGEASWFEFAAAIVAHGGGNGARRPRLVPIPSSAYPTPAARPLRSVLDNAALEADFGLRLPDWRRQLDLCLEP